MGKLLLLILFSFSSASWAQHTHGDGEEHSEKVITTPEEVITTAEEVITTPEVITKPEVKTTTTISTSVMKPDETQEENQIVGDYKAETCEWAADMPRRIVQGPGCDKNGSKICVAYVVCDRKSGAGKFVRMSTCSESNCGIGDAQNCTKQLPYRSFKPDDESKSYPSDLIRKILIQSNSSQQ